MRIVLLIAAVLVLPFLLLGQAKNAANDFYKYASPSKKWCIDDRSGPNLVVSETAKIVGIVSDELEKPVVNSEVLVTVKTPQTGQTVTSIHIGTNGSFNLGTLQAGEYSLRVVWARHGVFWRLAEVDKPKDLSCSAGANCHLDVFIWLMGGISHFNECSQIEGVNK